MVCGPFPGATPSKEPFTVTFAGSAEGYRQSRLTYICNSRRYNPSLYDLVVEDFSVYAPVFPRLQGRPMISIIHALYGVKALRYRGLYGLLSIFGEKVLLPGKKNVVAVSSHILPFLSRSARTVVIGQGVDVPLEFPPPGEEFVLFLGRLDFQVKGLDVLLEAWSLIPASERKLPLHIVGGGEQKVVSEKIRQLGVTDVRLVGRQDYRTALETMNRAAFVCMPSRSEGFPLVAVEAMALGKPVLVSDIPSLKANVPHGIAGLQTPVGDARALAREILLLLQDEALRQRLAAGARREGGKFSWNVIAERQEDFYQEVVADV